MLLRARPTQQHISKDQRVVYNQLPKQRLLVAWPVHAGVFEGSTGRVLFKPLLNTAGTAVTAYKYHFEMTLWPHKKRSDAVYTAASISAEIM
jgi:hypothetical protein